ncbi:S-adenosyl-L-methionine-dependent methyltransferase [Xylaria sp. CBS 124048]|nr:S-adenosyl-L-methionine-dependent methyltransferase [Xylaria sp. CBS 124048]
MPRLKPSLIHQAGRISPHLAALLPTCRTIASARNELRWINEHVHQQDPRRVDSSSNPDTSSSIARLVSRRAAGEPLQYVLGWQPFADLRVLCERGVLIPRPETEAWASLLADLVFSSASSSSSSFPRDKNGLRVLDLCSGTGCIGLSLFARGREEGREEGKEGVRVHLSGFDVEDRAVRLARRNLLLNFEKSGHDEAGTKVVGFRKADIFRDDWMACLDHDAAATHPASTEEFITREKKKDDGRKVDVLVSNPPYVSQRGFDIDTGRSVRNYEPKIALVPIRGSFPSAPASCAPEDIFYARLLEVADALRPRFAVFEVGDMAQAVRVVEMALRRAYSEPKITGGENDDGIVRKDRWEVVEIWRDWPDCLPDETEEDSVLVSGREVPIRGSGHGRVVFLAESRMARNRFTNRGFRREVYMD